jgi:hypothetical protein
VFVTVITYVTSSPGITGFLCPSFSVFVIVYSGIFTKISSSSVFGVGISLLTTVAIFFITVLFAMV